MKEELIQHTTAKLAKEKGFDWKARGSYYEDGNHSCHTFHDNDEYPHEDEYLKKTAVCNSPTQSLLQRWLREKHQIYVFVYPKTGKKCGYDTWPINGFSFEAIKHKDYWHVGMFDKLSEMDCGEEWVEIKLNTYEEALEKGLIEALKLIP